MTNFYGINVQNGTSAKTSKTTNPASDSMLGSDMGGSMSLGSVDLNGIQGMDNLSLSSGPLQTLNWCNGQMAKATDGLDALVADAKASAQIGSTAQMNQPSANSAGASASMAGTNAMTPEGTVSDETSDAAEKEAAKSALKNPKAAAMIERLQKDFDGDMNKGDKKYLSKAELIAFRDRLAKSGEADNAKVMDYILKNYDKLAAASSDPSKGLDEKALKTVGKELNAGAALGDLNYDSYKTKQEKEVLERLINGFDGNMNGRNKGFLDKKELEDYQTRLKNAGDKDSAAVVGKILQNFEQLRHADAHHRSGIDGLSKVALQNMVNQLNGNKTMEQLQFAATGTEVKTAKGRLDKALQLLHDMSDDEKKSGLKQKKGIFSFAQGDEKEKFQDLLSKLHKDPSVGNAKALKKYADEHGNQKLKEQANVVLSEIETLHAGTGEAPDELKKPKGHGSLGKVAKTAALVAGGAVLVGATGGLGGVLAGSALASGGGLAGALAGGVAGGALGGTLGGVGGAALGKRISDG